ncbi:hypothetical protein QTO34_017127 [Cnephaeus nilssonii]|uniref:Uncharacterized protein n=1 Tax=Cnephaeus nilssonii TaxID=3371016 RepID=A0AA40I0J0_CNENI|nr:hypothetical protein QTO34_017127 [Eptesicus nilssonii]
MDGELLLKDEQREWFLEMETTGEDAVRIVEIITKDLKYYTNLVDETAAEPEWIACGHQYQGKSFHQQKDYDSLKTQMMCVKSRETQTRGKLRETRDPRPTAPRDSPESHCITGPRVKSPPTRTRLTAHAAPPTAHASLHPSIRPGPAQGAGKPQMAAASRPGLPKGQVTRAGRGLRCRQWQQQRVSSVSPAVALQGPEEVAVSPLKSPSPREGYR